MGPFQGGERFENNQVSVQFSSTTKSEVHSEKTGYAFTMILENFDGRRFHCHLDRLPAFKLPRVHPDFGVGAACGLI